MAKWSKIRPEKHCDDAEIEVARYLDKLPDTWRIQWGFFYRDNKGTQCEGDFLILTPFSCLLVLEVKGWKETTVPYFAPTGEWICKSSDNPLIQLDQEHSAIVAQFKMEFTPLCPEYLHIAKAIAFPCLDLPVGDNWKGFRRDQFVTGNELDDPRLFEEAILERFCRSAQRHLVSKPRTQAIEAAFIKVYSPAASAQPLSNFVTTTEARFRQRLLAEYRLLDILRENRQLLVQGGCGSGKSWCAMQQARRYAINAPIPELGEEVDEKGSRKKKVPHGQNVLFLVYNRSLTQSLRIDIAHEKGKGEWGSGNIDVINFEELCDSIRTTLKAHLPNPSVLPANAGRNDFLEYYDVNLPGDTLTALGAASGSELNALRKYDAMVVDEGQDHDTVLHPDIAGQFLNATCGWWSIYLHLLKKGAKSPVSIFYDPSQRAPFRSEDRFDVRHLRSTFPYTSHAHLPRSIRYTQPIFDFLKSFNFSGSHKLVAAMGKDHKLPLGPPVVQVASKNEPEAIRKKIVAMITQWEKDELCQPEDVMILHPSGSLKTSAIGGKTFLTLEKRSVNLVDFFSPKKGVRVSSIHKAKGLDSLAVIVLNPARTPQQSLEYANFTLFMGASRARQMLGVIEIGV